jgi:hypothetical protein
MFQTLGRAKRSVKQELQSCASPQKALHSARCFSSGAADQALMASHSPMPIARAVAALGSAGMRERCAEESVRCVSAPLARTKAAENGARNSKLSWNAWLCLAKKY